MSPEQVPQPPVESTSLPRKIFRIEANGILFIGDPHITCARPGRRLEDDFLAVPLDKIMQARQIAEERNLLMVFLGDMMENPTDKKANTIKTVENTNLILSGFARAMNWRQCFTIPGNHDKNEVRLTAGTTLSTMRDLNLINVIEPGGAFAIVQVGDCRIGIGGTPYGETIPRDVRGHFGEEVDKVAWITHSQFEFDEPNPFLDKIFEIKGCDMVVNGHDHTTMHPKHCGQTHWFNPGNLTRMSVDVSNHKPSVWEWNPSLPDGQLHQHALRYNENAFDMRGLQIAPDVAAAKAHEIARSKSLFAELLMADQGTDLERTEGGDLLLADVEKYIAGKLNMSTAAQLMLRNLHQRAPERLKP